MYERSDSSMRRHSHESSLDGAISRAGQQKWRRAKKLPTINATDCAFC